MYKAPQYYRPQQENPVPPFVFTNTGVPYDCITNRRYLKLHRTTKIPRSVPIKLPEPTRRDRRRIVTFWRRRFQSRAIACAVAAYALFFVTTMTDALHVGVTKIITAGIGVGSAILEAGPFPFCRLFQPIFNNFTLHSVLDFAHASTSFV